VCETFSRFSSLFPGKCSVVEFSWNVMAHGDASEGKWRANWRMEWVAGTLHTTSERGVSSITTADAYTSAASSRLNWCPPTPRFRWARPFRRKTKTGFCACAITFQKQSTSNHATTNNSLNQSNLIPTNHDIMWRFAFCSQIGFRRIRSHTVLIAASALKLFRRPDWALSSTLQSHSNV